MRAGKLLSRNPAKNLLLLQTEDLVATLSPMSRLLLAAILAPITRRLPPVDVSLLRLAATPKQG
jgi:hypothetical protein